LVEEKKNNLIQSFCHRIEYVYLSIKDAHDRQYNYMKIIIFTLIGMIRLIGFNIQDIQIHVNIQFCNQ
jgi:hypothetical protein